MKQFRKLFILFILGFVGLGMSQAAIADDNFTISKNNETAENSTIIYSSTLESEGKQLINTEGPHTLFKEKGKYQLNLIGNNNVTGITDRRLNSVLPGTDLKADESEVNVFNSSYMGYQPLGENSKIKKAYLTVLSSPPEDLPTDKLVNAYIEGPRGGIIYFDNPYMKTYGNAPAQQYAYDITEFMQEQGTGRYWGKNIARYPKDAERDNYATWQIAIVEENPDLEFNQDVQLYYQGNRSSTGVKLKLDGQSAGIKSIGDINSSLLLTVAGSEDYKHWGTKYENRLTIKADNVGQLYSEEHRSENDAFNENITINGDYPSDYMPDHNMARYKSIDMILNNQLDSKYIPAGTKDIELSYNVSGGGIDIMFYGMSIELDQPDIGFENMNESEVDKKYRIYQKETVKQKVTLSKNDVGVSDPRLEVDLPNGIILNPDSFLVNNKKVPVTSYNDNQCDIILQEGSVTEELELEYELLIPEGSSFIEGIISSNLYALIQYPDGSTSDTEVKVNELQTEFIKQYQVKEFYHMTASEEVILEKALKVDATNEYVLEKFPDEFPAYLTKKFSYYLDLESENSQEGQLPIAVNKGRKDFAIHYCLEGNAFEFELLRNKQKLSIPADTIDIVEELDNAVQSIGIKVPSHIEIDSINLEDGWSLNQLGNNKEEVNILIDSNNDLKTIKEFLTSLTFTIKGPTNTDSSEVSISLSDNRTVARIHSDGETHYYRFVPGNLNWFEAYNAAQNLTYQGLRGYLMTVTEADEEAFIKKELSLLPGWLGGTRQVLSDGSKITNTKNISETYEDYDHGQVEWYWATGPESLLKDEEKVFGVGKIYVQNPNNLFTNWTSGEPNNATGHYKGYEEDTLQWGKQPSYTWNDLTAAYKDDNSGMAGYYVEFSEFDGQEIQQAKDLSNVTYAGKVPQPIKYIVKNSDDESVFEDYEIVFDENIKLNQLVDLTNLVPNIDNFEFVKDKSSPLEVIITDKEASGVLYFKEIFKKTNLIIQFVNEENDVIEEVTKDVLMNQEYNLLDDNNVTNIIESLIKKHLTIKTRPADEEKFKITKENQRVIYEIDSKYSLSISTDQLDFSVFDPKKGQNSLYENSKNLELHLVDSRAKRGKLKIEASMSTFELDSDNNKKLVNTRIIWKNNNQEMGNIKESQTVFSSKLVNQTTNEENIVLHDVANPEINSLELEIPTQSMLDGSYSNQIKWTVTPEI